MRSELLASLTSKIVIGVAATTLAAGSAGAVALQTISDETPTPVETTVETSVESADTTVVDDTSTDEVEEVDDAEEQEAAEENDDEVLGSFDEEVDTATAHPDNFGKIVSERAHANGGNKGGVADLAHAKNEARKAARDAEDKKHDESADEVEDEGAGQGKGHATDKDKSEKGNKKD